uniref:Uncharacterized protein n=1 Tax=Cajanus cajan TaxID=3821 RepID=A0A151R948_CAJCA|nr:hypothetical protein KK1_039548 [Cajanus cajan]
MLFIEKSVDQVDIVLKCLDEFCRSSGQKVSFAKAHMFVSCNVKYHDAMFFSTMLDFGLMSDLGKYIRFLYFI